MPVAADEFLDDLTFDGQVDLGGEVVALLADRRLRAVPGPKLFGHAVEDHRRLGHQRVEVASVRRHRSYCPTAARACGSVNRPA